jgi:4-amino-4-deoxy-L-arabinose transferase-like glycosyltransferase
MAARTRLLVLAIALLAGLLYAARLNDAPIYMMHDETQFALQAQSIASSGRDLGGRFMPVFFSEPEFPAGRDPVIIYASALVLRVLPFSEGSARLATALVGMLDVVLVFLVARRLFKSDYAGCVGAVLMALTPAHFIRARLGLSPMYSVPFVLLWLLALLAYDDRPSTRRLALGGAWLGLGVYTYLASVVMMPVYLGLTCLLALRARNIRAAVAATAAFLVALVPMLAWHLLHPERFGQVFGSYREFSRAAQLTVLEGIQARIAMYWSFFNPEFLFMTGDTSLVNSTRQVGFFPMAFVVLLPVGLHAIWKSGRPALWIIGIGLLAAPLAAIVSGAIEMNRIMYAMPFGALVAVIGAMALMAEGGWRRGVAMALVVSVAWQFAGFYRDYHGEYRARSAAWFGGNLRDAMVNVIDAHPDGQTTPIYVSAKIPFASRYWRFNALRTQRGSLIDAPIYFSDPPATAPGGSTLLCASAAAECAQLASSAEWRVSFIATEPDQTASFHVLTRQPGR